MRWAERARRAPLGVITLSALLAILGGALVLGGAWLGISRAGAGWPVWAAGLLVGPLAMYLALQLLSLTRWAWLALVVLTVLLLVSSLARLLLLPGLYFVPIGEIVVEAALLVYLWRPQVRAAFARP